MSIGRTRPSGFSTPRRFGKAFALTLMGLGVILPACSEDAAPPKALEQVSPTKAEVAKAAGFSFPASVSEFRLVRISGSNIQFAFRIAPGDVDAFASGSGLTLTQGKRVIGHASPVWELNPAGTFAGGVDTRNKIRREVEVVTNAGQDRVRISLTAL